MIGRARIALAVPALLLSASLATADVSSPAFAPLSGGARAYALSGASVALVDDADAAFVNPARLAFLRGRSFAVGYSRLVEGLPSDKGELVAALPLGQPIAAPFQKEGVYRAVLGLGADYQRLELAQGSSYGEFAGTLAAAFAPANIVAFGAALRGLRAHSEVDGLDASGASLDLGFTIALMPYMEAAVCGHNVAGSVKYEDGESEKPGHALDFALALARWKWARAEADFRSEYGGASSVAMGVEVAPEAVITLRGGFRRWVEPDDRFVGSAGIGIRHSGYFLDYGVRFDGDDGLGLVHRFSLGLRP